VLYQLYPSSAGVGFISAHFRLWILRRASKACQGLGPFYNDQVEVNLDRQERQSIFDPNGARSRSPKKGKRSREGDGETEKMDKRQRTDERVCEEIANRDHFDRRYNSPASITTINESTSPIHNTADKHVYDNFVDAFTLDAKTAIMAKFKNAAKAKEHFKTVFGLCQEELEQIIEADAMAATRKRWCQAQRPKDPLLICCNYDIAERVGVLESDCPEDYKKVDLCSECLGVERQELT